MIDAEKPKADKEFFDEIKHKIDHNVLAGMSNDMEFKTTVISLLVELNATMALLCQLMYGAMSQQNSESVIYCPKCKENVEPNQMGYCPQCKLDLVKQIKSDSIHLGKKVS